MAAATGAALRLARQALDGLVVDAARMAGNLEASQFPILVEAACAEAAQSGRHLMDVLAETSPAPLDWAGLRDPAGYLGAADRLIDRILAALAPAEAPKT